jgi:hypothetical protein
VESTLCIFLHWTTYSSKCFPLKSYKAHFHVNGHSPSFTCIQYDVSDYSSTEVFL